MIFILSVLVALLAVPHGAIQPQEPPPLQPGSLVRVTAPQCGLENYAATLGSVAADTVLLETDESSVRCLRTNVTRLAISRGRKSSGILKYALIGAPMGALVGALGFRHECGSWEFLI